MTVFVFIKLNALASDIPYIVMTVFVFIKLNALASDTPFIVMVCVFIKLNVLTTLLVEAHHTLCVNRIWMHTSINPDWSRPYIVWYQLWTHWHHSWLKQTIHYEGGGGEGVRVNPPEPPLDLPLHTKKQETYWEKEASQTYYFSVCSNTFVKALWKLLVQCWQSNNQ